MAGYNKDFKIKIQTIEELPQNITAAFVSVALMPNGEVVCLGETIGKYDDFRGYIFEEVSEKSEEVEG